LRFLHAHIALTRAQLSLAFLKILPQLGGEPFFAFFPCRLLGWIPVGHVQFSSSSGVTLWCCPKGFQSILFESDGLSVDAAPQLLSISWRRGTVRFAHVF
jgi:hypothetical protein